MPNNSKNFKNYLTEDITGVATVSSPEVGKNIQYPIGQAPGSYIKRNKKYKLKSLRLQPKPME